jgi:NTP pyrophosphatase (non-canonical NTP hydrolase)
MTNVEPFEEIMSLPSHWRQNENGWQKRCTCTGRKTEQDITRSRKIRMTMKIMINYRIVQKHLMLLITHVGDLAKHLNDSNSKEWSMIAEQFFKNLLSLGDHLRIDVVKAIRAKMLLNAQKYPVNQCQGSVRKYTEYTSVTNISKNTGQKITDEGEMNRKLLKEHNDCNSFFVKMKALTKEAIDFSNERSWNKYDRPNHLILALTTEVGELCEIFQWDNDENVASEISYEKWDNAAKELADVVIYSLKLHYKVTNR